MGGGGPTGRIAMVQPAVAGIHATVPLVPLERAAVAGDLTGTRTMGAILTEVAAAAADFLPVLPRLTPVLTDFLAGGRGGGGGRRGGLGRERAREPQRQGDKKGVPGGTHRLLRIGGRED